MKAACGRHETDLRMGLAERRHVDPGQRCLGRSRDLQPDAEARGTGARQHQVQHCRVAGEDRRHRLQVQGQAAQRGVRQVHRDDAAAGQQEGQHVAQVQLVVDGGDQQHQQRGAEHPAGPRRQDVDVALRQQQRVGARLARAGPGLEAGPQVCRRVQTRRHGSGGFGHGAAYGSGTASTIARTCSTRPRPAPATGTSRCAMVCGSTYCTSSGAT